MPIDPGHGERLAARVSDLYAAAELNLLRRIARALAQGIDSPQWAVDKLAQIDWLRTQLRAETTALTAQAVGEVQHVITTAWTHGQALAVGDLDGLDLDVRVPPSRMAGILLLASETLEAVRPVGDRLLRAALDIYQRTAAEAAATVLLGADTRRGAAQHALNRLTGHGVKVFTDTTGRRWEAASYVEMAVRTGAGKAAVQGHVEQLAANGLDLVMVSDHPRECELCRPWEGKVLSIGGAVAGVIEVPSTVTDQAVKVRVAGSLDDARRAGFQHPNCRHSISAYLPGASRPATDTKDSDARYAQEQHQRYLERGIRAWKRREATALTPEEERAARAKVRQWQARLREHLAATQGLDRKPAREQVARAR